LRSSTAGVPNQGMRCLREILEAHDGQMAGLSVLWDEFDVRGREEVPGLDYDVYLSSGGPGSPFDGEGSAWEARYFGWLDALWAHEQKAEAPPKSAFLICHSFELAVRHFGLARLEPRRSESFGIYPVHPVLEGRHEPLFEGLDDPFYAADFRSWQAVSPDPVRFAELGAELLAVEKDRPHVPLERAMMAIRFSEGLVGTQFHPEADPDGMLLHFRQEHRREDIVARHGTDKYARILHLMTHPAFLARTYATVLPNFLRRSVARLRGTLPDDGAA
jgi:homoserine O-succinyltransferase/O-acetyltransferase